MLARHRYVTFALLFAVATSATVFVSARTTAPATRAGAQAEPRESLWVCSFNVQFLGSFGARSEGGQCLNDRGNVCINGQKDPETNKTCICRDNEALAQLMQRQGCDIVVVQELVAPPSEHLLEQSLITPFASYSVHNAEGAVDPDRLKQLEKEQKELLAADPAYPFKAYPDGSPIESEPKSTRFFNEMIRAGYPAFVLSEEDTGSSPTHTNGTATEWWVAFFKPDKVEVATDLPHGFLSDVRLGTGKPFVRVPYAFPFRTKSGKFDFVLISVHLQPDPGSKNEAIRKAEIAAIHEWIGRNNETEQDFLILGDTNLQSAAEMRSASPYPSLNDACVYTNTNPNGPKPYEHVFFHPTATSELEVPRELELDGQRVPNFFVVDLRREMESRWQVVNSGLPYPGGTPYVHDRFRTEYSDHNPVKFKILEPTSDDDASTGPVIVPSPVPSPEPSIEPSPAPSPDVQPAEPARRRTFWQWLRDLFRGRRKP